MKTKTQLLVIVSLTFLLGACSTSLQVNSSLYDRGDDIYYTPSTKTYVVDAKNSDSSIKPQRKKDILEQQYQDFLAKQNSETDTVAAENGINPYQGLLSDSYQDSYERRIRGAGSPYYGLDDWSARYSDDYWYASSYDPAYYNVIVMGSNVWAEPYYISSMFGWPYGYYSYWRSPRPWYWSWHMSWHSPYYYGHNWGAWGYPHSYHYSPWSYGWGSYNYGFWQGVNWGSQSANAGNYTYGIRPDGRHREIEYVNNNKGPTIYKDTRRDISDRQVVLDNSNESGRRPVGNEASTKPLRVSNESPVGMNVADAGTNDKRIVREPMRGTVDGGADRLTGGEIGRINPTRVNNGSSTGRVYNPSYARPNSANSSDFNRTNRSRQPNTENVRQNIGSGAVKPAGTQSGPRRTGGNEMNRTNRINTTKPASSSSGSSGYSTPRRTTQSSSSSSSSSRSSVGSSSSSGRSSSSSGSSVRSSGSSSSNSSGGRGGRR